jgi:hypothetical protein
VDKELKMIAWIERAVSRLYGSTKEVDGPCVFFQFAPGKVTCIVRPGAGPIVQTSATTREGAIRDAGTIVEAAMRQTHSFHRDVANQIADEMTMWPEILQEEAGSKVHALPGRVAQLVPKEKTEPTEPPADAPEVIDTVASSVTPDMQEAATASPEQ